MADYDRYDSEGSGFMMGLIAGTVLGAGLGMLLAPKSGSDIRGAIGEQARHLGNRASETANTWAERGRDMVNHARDAVSRGVDEARNYAGGTTGSGYPGGSTGANTYPGGSTGSTYGGSTGTTPGSFGSGTGSDFNRS